jgi:hypothetical protein
LKTESAENNNLAQLHLSYTHTQPHPEVREEDKRAAPPPSPSFENSVVVVAAKESGERGPEGPESEPRPIVIGDYLAKQIKSRWA